MEAAEEEEEEEGREEEVENEAGDKAVENDEEEENEESRSSSSSRSSIKPNHDTKADGKRVDVTYSSSEDWMVGVDSVTSLIPQSLSLIDEKNQENHQEVNIDIEQSPHPSSMMTNIPHQEWQGLDGVIPPSWRGQHEWQRVVTEDDTTVDGKDNLHSVHRLQRHVDHPSYYDYPTLRRQHSTDTFEVTNC